MLNRVRIVLVNTYHPGNIGSAARAMKVMGMERLYLVNPTEFPHEEASTMAAGAEDILANAVVTSSLEEAVADCTYVVATSARPRSHQVPAMTPPQCANFIAEQPEQDEIAIVFGRERSGLTAEEYHRCNRHVFIPANPDYAILNMASAVQIITYELYQKSLTEFNPVPGQSEWPNNEEMGFFFDRMEKALENADYFKGKPQDITFGKLRAYFQRNLPEKFELSLLHGLVKRLKGNP
ncbi:RNA methyltransferase [Oceanospirillum beijerinckii]|uniref:RNA methyltransferase n=1 Tax=Oceanospirillum beijerinckii TaxID=64976 RepID=UPI000407B359|nr:RNA methyltransferase [Oceanospirillum beijerinckii]